MISANKKIVIYLFLTVFFLLFILNPLYLINQIIKNDDIPVVSIEKLNYGDQLISDKMLKPEEYGEKELTAKFDGAALKDVEGDIAMVVSRLRGTYSEIFINGHLVGSVGIKDNFYIDNWNHVSRFYVPRNYIRANENTLRIKSDTSFKIGISGFPIFISDEHTIDVLHTHIVFLYYHFYSVCFGMLISLALIQIVIFSTKGIYDKRFFIIPAIVILWALAINDYMLHSTNLLSVDLKHKLFYVFLYSAVLLFVRVLYHFYDTKTFYYGMLSAYIFAIPMVLLAPNMTALSVRTSMFDASLLFAIVFSIYVLIKDYIKTKNSGSLLLFLSLLTLMIPTVFEVLSVMFDGFNIRPVPLGFVLFSMGLSIEALDRFKDRVTEKVTEIEALKKEAEVLKRGLYSDELTGLYNHRYLVGILEDVTASRKHCVDVLTVDIDKFSAFNDVNGYQNGDLALQKIAHILSDVTKDKQNCYRYADKRFVYLNFDKKYAISDIAEQIRRRVETDQQLVALAGATPLTVSCGIASFPTDASNVLTVILRANKAVQVAKKRGRNRVVKYFKDIIYELEDISFVKFRQKMLIDFIYSLANVIDMKDKYTGHHSEEVAKIAVLIGERMGLGDEDLTALRLGSMLHDFGKIGMPDVLINKNDKLTDEENRLMQSHPIKGYNIIKNIIDDQNVLEIIKYHHERYDGKGYPEQLKAEDIPHLARIVCVADAYHEMTSAQPYRSAMKIEEAVIELEKGRAKQFDSAVIDVLIEALIDAGLISKGRANYKDKALTMMTGLFR